MSDEQKQQHPLRTAVEMAWTPRDMAFAVANYIIEQERNARPPFKMTDAIDFLNKKPVEETITALRAENDRLRAALTRASDLAINPPKLMLPLIASKWHGGFYAGVVRNVDVGVDHHLIQLEANTPKAYVNWDDAIRAAANKGRLPSPREASLLYANGMLEGEKNLVWTSTAAGRNHALAINPQNGEISHVNKALNLAWTSVKTMQV